MSAKKVNRLSKEFYIATVLALVTLLLTAININLYLEPKVKTVLAAEAENTDFLFWENFLNKNPNYIPGWIEIGREDKVWSIDPNYFSR